MTRVHHWGTLPSQLPLSPLCPPALASLTLSHTRLAPASGFALLILLARNAFPHTPRRLSLRLQCHLRATLFPITNYLWIQFSSSFYCALLSPPPHFSPLNVLSKVHFFTVCLPQLWNAMRAENLVLFADLPQGLCT